MSITKCAAIGVGAAVTSAVGIGAAVAVWAAGSAIAGASHSAPSNSTRGDSVPGNSVRAHSAPGNSTRNNSAPSTSAPSTSANPSVPGPSVEQRVSVFLDGYDSATHIVSFSTATRVNGGPDNGYWQPGSVVHEAALAPDTHFYSAFADCAGGGGLTVDDHGIGSTSCSASAIRSGEIAWITIRTGNSGAELIEAREIYHP